MSLDALSIANIEAARTRIGPFVIETPVVPFSDEARLPELGVEDLLLKLEFLQRTGSFKARGAVNNALALTQAEKERGIVAVSAGNHAIAAAYAARAANTRATVVMPKTANPARVDKCRALGAEVVLTADVAEAFAQMIRLRDEEGLSMIHPFEGQRTLEGTGTCGLEIAEAVDAPDAVLVSVGGGGLIGGIGAAIRQRWPKAQIIGIEPEGACGMTRSLEMGSPLEKVEVSTIADSMGAPLHMEFSFNVCREVIDRMVLLDDQAMKRGMAFAFDALKLALEPAGAATLAALAGPLKGQMKGKRVVAVICGSNIDFASYAKMVEEGKV